MAENIKILIEAEDRASPVLSKIQSATNNAAKGFSNLGSSLDSTGKSLNRTADAFGNLESAARALAGAYAVGATLQFVNTIQELDNRLRLVTNTTGELNATYNKLFQVSQNTRQGLDGTINLYSKLAMSADALGLNTDQLTKITENFNKTLLVSGTSTQGANAALYQFAQAMQSGRLQGDELRTLLETTPKFMDVLRNTTGLTTAELRKLATDGFLSSSIVAQALIDATDDLNSSMDKMPITVSQATTQLKNSMQSTVRSFLDATNGSETLTGAIAFLNDNVVTVTVALGTFAAAMAIGAVIQAASFAMGGLAIAAAGATTAITALKTATLLLTQTPLGRLAALVGVAGAALFGLSGDADAAEKSQDKLTTTTDKLSTTQKNNNGVSAEMAKLMDQQGVTAKTTETAFSKYEAQLKSQIATGHLFSDSRKSMMDIDKALQETIEDGRKRNKIYTDEEIANMRARLVAQSNLRDETLRTTQELENRYKDYISFIKKQQDSGLTDQQKFDNEVKRFTEDRLKYTKEQEEQTAGYLDALRKEYSEKYVKLIQEASKKVLTDREEFDKNFSQLEDDFLNNRLSKNINFEDALEALRKNYSEKYVKLIKDENDKNLTDTQRFQRDLAQLEEDQRSGRLSKEVNFEDAKDALRSKYNRKFIDDAKKALEEDQGAFGSYSAKMLELNSAYRAGLFTTDQQYFALVNKARQDYINATVSEYSTLYSTVEGKLLDILDINKSKWPLIKEVIKLFGVDSDKILKDLFTQGIDYIKGFTTGGTAQFKGMQTETTSIFSGIGNFISNLFSGSGSLLGSIGNWVSSALNMFKGFGSSLFDILGGVGNWISSLFGGGGSIISSVTSGLSTVVSTIGTMASAVSSGVSATVSTIGSALGIGGGAAAGGAAAGGAAAGGSAAAGVLGTIGSTIIGGLGIGAAIVGGVKLIEKIFPADKPVEATRAREEREAEEYRQREIRAYQANRLHQIEQQERTDEFNGRLIAASKDFLSKYSISGIPGGYNIIDKATRQIVSTRNISQDLSKTPYASVGSALIGQTGLTGNMNTVLAYLLAGNAEFGAKGLAYNNGNLINNATVFGTNSGLAVGGELGTEAIMPLSRGADGRLGVTVNGAGNGNVNINFTINAVDAKGIDTMLVERKSLITNIVRSAMQDRGVRI